MKRALLALAMLAGASSAQATVILLPTSFVDGASVQFNNGVATSTSMFAKASTGQQIAFTAGGAQLRADGIHSSLEGALDTSTRDPNDTLPLNQLEFHLTDGGTFNNVELTLFGGDADSVSFSLTDTAGSIYSYKNLALRSGDNSFGFISFNNQSIRTLAFTLAGGGIGGVRDIRLDALPPAIRPGAVPEPSTWAMLLVGFGSIGYSLRARRPRLVRQAV